MLVDDFQDDVRTFGIESPWAIARTFQSMPIRHRGVEVGSFFLTERPDGEAFTADNEEVLMPFTCRAALAVANQCHPLQPAVGAARSRKILA